MINVIGMYFLFPTSLLYSLKAIAHTCINSYCTYIHSYINACTFLRTYIHAYIHTYMHVHIYIYIYIYVCVIAGGNVRK